MKTMIERRELPVLRAKDAAAFLGIGLSTFWRWVQEGRIAKGVHLSARATVWRRTDLEQFLEQAAAGTRPLVIPDRVK